MVNAPERIIPDFIQSGANHISFHLEGNVHITRIIQLVKSLGSLAGIAIVPSTPVATLTELLGMVDIVLVMTVNPGLRGQDFMPGCLDKVIKLDRLRKQCGYRFLISVDGGISRSTSQSIREAGADILVSGRSFFDARNPVEEVHRLKGKVSGSDDERPV